jgi:hypothetical protein
MIGIKWLRFDLGAPMGRSTSSLGVANAVRYNLAELRRLK